MSPLDDQGLLVARKVDDLRLKPGAVTFSKCTSDGETTGSPDGDTPPSTRTSGLETVVSPAWDWTTFMAAAAGLVTPPYETVALASALPVTFNACAFPAPSVTGVELEPYKSEFRGRTDCTVAPCVYCSDMTRSLLLNIRQEVSSFQRALGAENKDKREKLNAIVHAVVEAAESTPLVPPKKPGE